MKLRPALVLLTASLGAGGGARLWLAQGNPQPVSTPAGAPQAASAAPSKTSALTKNRPAEADVVSLETPDHYARLMAWLPGASAEELERMAVAGMEDEYSLSTRLVMARWAEVDPAGMVAWAARTKEAPGMDRSYLESNVWEAWGRVDFDAAWNALKDNSYRRSVLLGLTGSDPARALEILRGQPELLRGKGGQLTGKGDDMNTEALMARIARRFPREAAELYSRHLAQDKGVPWGILSTWALTDPVQALLWARGKGQEAVSAAFSGLAENQHREGQVECTAAMAAALPSGSLRMRFDALVLAELAGRDPGAAMTAYEAMPPGDVRQFSALTLMTAFSRQGRDAEAMALATKVGWRVDHSWLPEFVQVSTPGTNGSDLYGDPDPYDEPMLRLARKLAENDPEAALATIKNGAMDEVVAVLIPLLIDRPAELADALVPLPDTDNLTAAPDDLFFSLNIDRVTPVLDAWLDKDPQAAAAWVTESEARSECLEEFCELWVAKDEAALVEWTKKNGTFAGRVWDHIAETKPELMMRHMAEAVAAAPEEADDWISTVESVDSAKIPQFLQLLPDTASLTSNAMDSWISEEPEEATRWAESLPESEKRTTAIESIAAYYMSEKEFEAAARWRLTLPEDHRDYALKDTFVEWMENDPEAARAAFHKLPAERQGPIRERLSTIDQ